MTREYLVVTLPGPTFEYTEVADAVADPSDPGKIVTRKSEPIYHQTFGVVVNAETLETAQRSFGAISAHDLRSVLGAEGWGSRQVILPGQVQATSPEVTIEVWQRIT